MKTKILFMGASAIGRGYLPWILDKARHEFIFIDSDQVLVDRLNAKVLSVISEEQNTNFN